MWRNPILEVKEIHFCMLKKSSSEQEFKAILDLGAILWMYLRKQDLAVPGSPQRRTLRSPLT